MDKTVSNFKKNCAVTGGGIGPTAPPQENPDLLVAAAAGPSGDHLAVLKESLAFTNNPGIIHFEF